MDRQTLAYLLIALMAVAAAAFVAFKIYHSHERTYLRQSRRERSEYLKRMEAEGRP